MKFLATIVKSTIGVVFLVFSNTEASELLSKSEYAETVLDGCYLKRTDKNSTITAAAKDVNCTKTVLDHGTGHYYRLTCSGRLKYEYTSGRIEEENNNAPIDFIESRDKNLIENGLDKLKKRKLSSKCKDANFEIVDSRFKKYAPGKIVAVMVWSGKRHGYTGVITGIAVPFSKINVKITDIYDGGSHLNPSTECSENLFLEKHKDEGRIITVNVGCFESVE